MIPVMLVLLSSCNSRQKEMQEITQVDTPIHSSVSDTTLSWEAPVVMTGSQTGVDSTGSDMWETATGSMDHTGTLSGVATGTLDATGTDSPLVVRNIAQVSSGTQSASTGTHTTPAVRIEWPGQTIETPSVVTVTPPTRTTPTTSTSPKPTPTTPVKTPTNTQPTNPPPVAIKPATPASVTTDRTVTYMVPDGDAKMRITIITKEGTISSVVIKNMAVDPTSVMYQDQFIKSVSAKVVGKPVKWLKIGIIAWASLTTESFNNFLQSL